MMWLFVAPRDQTDNSQNIRIMVFYIVVLPCLHCLTWNKKLTFWKKWISWNYFSAWRTKVRIKANHHESPSNYHENNDFSHQWLLISRSLISILRCLLLAPYKAIHVISPAVNSQHALKNKISWTSSLFYILNCTAIILWIAESNKRVLWPSCWVEQYDGWKPLQGKILPWEYSVLSYIHL